MSYKKYVVVIAVMAMMISSCTRPAPGGNTTAVPTNPFAKPLATNQMQEVEQKATQTALAKTAVAAGGPSPTPGGAHVPSVTPNIGGVIPSPTPTVGLPGGNLIPSSTPIGGTGGSIVPTRTSVVVTGRPPSYTLMEGEFPYCIARRYDVDPTRLLELSGLSDGVIYPAGTVLQIPQSGFFPGDRALRPHPTTYNVTSPNETFYSIACLFGDVHPSQISQVNGINLGTSLTVGQPIKIP